LKFRGSVVKQVLQMRSRTEVSGENNIPTKLGFKSVKNRQVIEVTNIYPGGFWEDQGYNWFSGS
jgi:hypothetical protein